MSIPAATSKRFVPAFVLTAALVLLWGLGHRLYDMLMPLFGQNFQLTGVRLGLMQSIYNFAYLFAAIPAALYARRFGYKATILLGLGFLAAGAFTFYPAAGTQAFGFLAIAVSSMALGWLVLEIAANPLFAAFGSPERAVFRLNLAQTLYPVGAVIGIIACRWIISQDMVLPHAGARFAIGHPYIVVGALVLLLAFLIEEAEYPPVAQERIPGARGLRSEFTSLLARPMIRFAMVAQAAGLLALAAVWTIATKTLTAVIPATAFPLGDAFLLAVILFAIGRLLGTALMWWLTPALVLAGFMAMAVLAALVAALTTGLAAAIATFALSILLSIVWPTVLGLALNGLRQEMKLTTALLVMAGTLGGLFQRFLNLTTGGMGAAAEFVLAAISCTVVLAFALWCIKSAGPAR